MTKRKKSGADEEVSSPAVGRGSSTAERMELQSNTCGVVHPTLGWPCQLSSGHSGSHWAAPNSGQAGFATYWTYVLGRLVSTSERGEGEAASLEAPDGSFGDEYIRRVSEMSADKERQVQAMTKYLLTRIAEAGSRLEVAPQEVSREAQGGAVTFPAMPSSASVESELRAEVERLQAEVARLQKRVAGFRARRRR